MSEFQPYGGIGSDGSWWSSTEKSTKGAYSRNMSNRSSDVSQSVGYKQAGFSVRCVLKTKYLTIDSSNYHNI